MDGYIEDGDFGLDRLGRDDVDLAKETSFNAVFSRVITKTEASFVGPVIGQRTQFSTTKEFARFLRINNALLPFFVVKSLLRLVF